MLASYYLAALADDYVAASQRKELGLCTKCGGLNADDQKPCTVDTCPLKSDQ
jgi:hypothetical protein